MKGAENMDKNSFKQPSVYNKPVPFWSWNDKLENGELVRQIDEMADKGWGGFFAHKSRACYRISFGGLV